MISTFIWGFLTGEQASTKATSALQRARATLAKEDANAKDMKGSSDSATTADADGPKQNIEQLEATANSKRAAIM